MKGTTKLVFSLVLTIVLLISLFGLLTIGYVGFWLHTYNAFTKERPVAELTVSELKSDTKGSYFEVEYTPYIQYSALETLLRGQDNSLQRGASKDFKLYGDIIYVEGPIVKFKNELILFNFDTIYKVGKIYSRYEDSDVEQKRADDMTGTVDIDPNYDEYRALNTNWKKDDLMGNVLRMFIDDVRPSNAPEFVGEKEEKYILKIGNNGLDLDLTK